MPTELTANGYRARIGSRASVAVCVGFRRSINEQIVKPAALQAAVWRLGHGRS